jgi:hypothetical protein
MEDLTTGRDTLPAAEEAGQLTGQTESAVEQGDDVAGGAASSGEKTYARYKIYDRIKDHVSLRAVDAIIIISAVLIVVLLIYGIMTGSPRT